MNEIYDRNKTLAIRFKSENSIEPNRLVFVFFFLKSQSIIIVFNDLLCFLQLYNHYATNSRTKRVL